jgi:hypothetical protein
MTTALAEVFMQFAQLFQLGLQPLARAAATKSHAGKAYPAAIAAWSHSKSGA